MNKKTLLSGVKPTGRPHIGNYFGAMKQFVDMQDDYNALYMIVDYHALNFIQNKSEMSQNIIDLTLDYLALGLDPQKSLIFKQSDVAEHAELAWIFDTITTMPYLMRAHAYKDAEAKNKEISVGAFNYPMLMAADILLYDTDIVPVGQDQKQHVEYARDTAQKFNNIFCKTIAGTNISDFRDPINDVFKLPDVKILPDVAVVPGTDGRKMSKSYGNTIPLFAHSEEIKKAVMSIPTDSKAIADPKNPDEDTVFKLYTLFAESDELASLRNRYENTSGTDGIGYKEAKEILIDKIESFIAPLRDKRAQLEHDTDYVLDVLREGGKRAKQRAERKMELVREAIGVKLY